jgi:hypothetical protein
MTASDAPPFVFRNVSLTMRERFTPARSCSTFTRIRASFRLVRFSAAVSSPPGVFFFRLARLPHGRCIPLEAGVLVQDRVRRIGDALRLGNLLLVRRTGVRAAQVVNPLPPGVDDDQVLVAVLLLAAAVVQGLFSRAFRPLAAPLRGVDDQPGRGRGRGLGPGEAAGVPLGANPEAIQRRLEDGQQPVDPMVHLRLAEPEEFAQDDLERVGLEVDQEEQESILGALQLPLPPAAAAALPGLARGGAVSGIQPPRRRGEGGQEPLKLPYGQPGQSQEPAAIASECCVA